MITMVAFFDSTRRAIWLMPHLTLWSLDLAAAAPFSAVALRRSSFCSFDSGRYLLSILKMSVALFLSTVLVNCAIAGGTLRRVYKIRRWRCILTFLGILTILLRSFLGCTLLPMPKFLGLRWKREFSFSFLGAFLEAVVAAGAAGFFGCIHIQMIACQQKTKQHTALPSTHCHSTAIARPSLNEPIIKCSTVQIDTRVRVYAIPCITHVQHPCTSRSSTP
mmetsp:Transcript_76027/g.123479  ORF Transcript_76027/g.123479 Transcript_76027/m.123479 type:complete len:220 (-) Transcript_76027:395-1054(-)